MLIANVADFREAARRAIPRFLFDYVDGGAGSEHTLRCNERDLQALVLRQQVMSGVDVPDLSTTVLGEMLSLPVILAPVGLAGLNARRGETLAMRAARRAGVPFVLSTVSACTIEEVSWGAGAPPWFQLYMIRDRGFLREMLGRAKAAGSTTLVFTVDMPVPGIRYRDIHSGLSGGRPMARHAKRLWQAALRPGWCWDVGLRGRPHTLGHVASVLGERAGVDAFWQWMGENFDPTVTWRDLERVRAEWDGPMLVKGILDPADAIAAVGAGADGIVVSNHGGRQLDGALSSARALPSIVEAVGDRCAVLMDGGVRSGADIVRALALGARAVLLGRPWVWALGARGEAGVLQMLEILAREMRVAMTLTGCTSVAAIGADVLAGPVSYPNS